MSRNKECYDLSGSTREAVGSGVAATAPIITGAAPIIGVVFAGVAHGQLPIALLLDAAVMRSVVLPSMLSLLDVRSWYLARLLDPASARRGREGAGSRGRLAITAMIGVETVAKRFGSTEALAGVSLAVERGPVLALLGPNGAGKTTLLRILTLLRPDRGLARVTHRLRRRRPTPSGCAR